jgi:hypothetical protein
MSVWMYSFLSYPAFKSHYILRRTVLSYMACLAVPYFTTSSHKQHDYEKTFLNIVRVFIFSTNFV